MNENKDNTQKNTVDDDLLLSSEFQQLANFVAENKKAGGLGFIEADLIKGLVEMVRVTKPTEKHSIVSCNCGFLGSIVIRNIESIDEPVTLSYEPGNYEFISICASSTRRILFTDYKDIQPYNRQYGLYCNGASFGMLGLPVAEHEGYREFDITLTHKSNISFGVWGFCYNDFYGTVQFGVAIPTDKVDKFIKDLRALLGK